MEGNKPLKSVKGISRSAQQADEAIVDIGSGTYTFTYVMNLD